MVEDNSFYEVITTHTLRPRAGGKKDHCAWALKACLAVLCCPFGGKAVKLGSMSLVASRK